MVPLIILQNDEKLHNGDVQPFTDTLNIYSSVNRVRVTKKNTRQEIRIALVWNSPWNSGSKYMVELP